MGFQIEEDLNDALEVVYLVIDDEGAVIATFAEQDDAEDFILNAGGEV